MSEAEKNKLQDVIYAMGYEEKLVAVRCIPTEILEDELKRRSSKQREQNNLLKELVKNMEKH